MSSLDSIKVKGFKSIKELELELTQLNVIIGANGSGKSNLIAFFRILHSFVEQNLNRYVVESGGATDLLFNGPKVTDKMEFETLFGKHGFRFNLVSTSSDECATEKEERYYSGGTSGWWPLGNNADGKSNMANEVINKTIDAKYSQPVFDAISSWQIYHFHDTSKTAGMRLYEFIQDDKVLRHNADNLAPFLLKLKEKHPKEYANIVNTIQLAIPFFNDFILEPQTFGPKEKVNLSWTQKGSDYPMQPYHLSDASIRFICLATALLQPNPPSTIIIDEPELGLHPSAILILAKLIEQASTKAQLIIATQSPLFIDQFDNENLILANREEDNASAFKRLKKRSSFLLFWKKKLIKYQLKKY